MRGKMTGGQLTEADADGQWHPPIICTHDWRYRGLWNVYGRAEEHVYYCTKCLETVTK